MKTRRKIKKARTMKILDEATMTYSIVNLYNVVFSAKKLASFEADGTFTVQVYSPSDAEVLDIANRLYANKGAFGSAVSFERVL